MSNDIIIRKNYSQLTDTEKKTFIDALRLLQKTKQGGTNFTIYEKYVIWHVQAMSIMTTPQQNRAHGGPVFLPWHREYLRRFEIDLRTIAQDNSLFLPYWNWVEDQDNPQKSNI